MDPIFGFRWQWSSWPGCEAVFGFEAPQPRLVDDSRLLYYPSHIWDHNNPRTGNHAQLLNEKLQGFFTMNKLFSRMVNPKTTMLSRVSVTVIHDDGCARGASLSGKKHHETSRNGGIFSISPRLIRAEAKISHFFVWYSLFATSTVLPLPFKENKRGEKLWPSLDVAAKIARWAVKRYRGREREAHVFPHIYFLFLSRFHRLGVPQNRSWMVWKWEILHGW